VDGLEDVVADGLGRLLHGEAGLRHGPEKKLVDGVVFDRGGELTDGCQHEAGEDLVPPEVALEVDALGAQAHGVPDGRAGLHAGRLHLVALGDDAGPLVAQHAHGLAQQEVVAHPLGRDVEAVGVEMADR
jgi:hypothetical protein